jgi:Protein of unknown function (DUF2950)
VLLGRRHNRSLSSQGGQAKPREALGEAGVQLEDVMGHSVAINPAEGHKHRVVADGRACQEEAEAAAAVVVAAVVVADVVVVVGVAVVAADATDSRSKPMRIPANARQSKTSGLSMVSSSERPLFAHGRTNQPWLLMGISAAIGAVLLVVSAVAGRAQENQQRSFATPGAAVKALVEAAKNDDMKALESILGPEADEVLSSGDPVADNIAREDFVRRFGQMRRLAFDDHGRVLLYIGADNWPVPIPLVKTTDGWIFDTPAGKEELLFRRIGANELFTIDVLEDLVTAQQEYSAEHHGSSETAVYAQKIVSDSGKRNGLFWPTKTGEPESPMGPRFAQASNEGYEPDPKGNPVPFHGYYYKVLTKQGKDAPGGAVDYVVDGKMSKGYAFLAYPADYGSSGIVTFMVDKDGIIVQKDLGAHTDKIARSMSSFDPDDTWDEDLED